MVHRLPDPITTHQEAILSLRVSYYNKLSKYFSSEKAYKFVPRDIKDLLIDWLILKDYLKKTKFKTDIILDDEIYGEQTIPEIIQLDDVMIDRAFIITPAFKAYEGFLYHLLAVFNLPIEKYKSSYKNVGFFYDLDEQYKHNIEILELIKTKMKNKDGVERWTELYGILKRFRHSPAHYLGGGVETFEMAEGFGHTLITAINGMSTYIIENIVNET